MSKRVRLICHLQMGSGVLVHGYTHDIAQEGVTMEAQPLPKHQQNSTPKAGDMGLLVLQYTRKGSPESIKIRSRVMNTQANRIGLHLFYSKMSKRDQVDLNMIIEKGSEHI